MADRAEPSLKIGPLPTVPFLLFRRYRLALFGEA